MKTQIYTDKKIMLKQIIVLFSVFSFLFSLCGCEAFRRKFVRKPKKEKEIKVIVTTHEYESEYSKEEIYKKYFLFCKTYYEELVNSLNTQQANRKKRVFAAEKIIENLQQIQKFLLPEKQKEIDHYIMEQRDILRELSKHRLNRVQKLRIKNILKKQKKQLQEDFSYERIKGYLKKE